MAPASCSPYDATLVTDVTVTQLAEAFGLAEPTGPAHSMRRRGQVEAWRIPTRSGNVLVKRFWADDELPWQAQLEVALELERRAVAADIDTPAPIEPIRPVFGSVARIEGHGLYRAFPFVEHRGLSDDDDVAEWLGATLARTHALQPLDHRPDPNWWYCQFPPVAEEQWLGWLRDGEVKGAVWASPLRQQIDLVLDQARQVVATFDASPPYAVSHRDVESWNILMAEAGPMLIDWDGAGPESIPLEAAYVFITFACRGRQEPDPELVQRSYRAYLDAGGPAFGTQTAGLLDRIVGTELSRIAESLGRFFDTFDDDDKVRDRIEQFPTVVQNARTWERLFDVGRSSL